MPAMASLSWRELEIVTGLLAGERVPMIAGRLHLSQSTVRNHLTSVYRKLGVNSQQELLTVLRQTK
jgi:DNA-binding NarL/FixJ family response regulator